jgi:tetratricopeptide (TPR) repeat protein
VRAVRLIALVLCCCAVAQTQNPAADSAVTAHYERARQAVARQDYSAAEREFQAIVKLNPGLAEGHANLGSVYFVRGDYEKAAGAFRQALGVKPDLARAAAFLGISEARLGRADQALEHLEAGFWKSARDEWRLQAGLILAELHAGRGRYDEAHKVSRALEESDPQNPDVLYLAYRLHSVVASRAIERLVKAGPGSARLYQVAGELLDAEGSFQAAVEQYRKALEADPRLPGIRRVLGVALMHAGDDAASHAEARRLFVEELALNPGDAHAEYQLGVLLWLESRPEEALARFERAAGLHPAFTDALIAAAKCQNALGKPQHAIDLLRRAAELDSDNEVVHYRLAQAYQKAGKREEATAAMARFRAIRSAMDSLRAIQRQTMGARITSQTVDTP